MLFKDNEKSSKTLKQKQVCDEPIRHSYVTV